jgi:hypothetical protein
MLTKEELHAPPAMHQFKIAVELVRKGKSVPYAERADIFRKCETGKLYLLTR